MNLSSTTTHCELGQVAPRLVAHLSREWVAGVPRYCHSELPPRAGGKSLPSDSQDQFVSNNDLVTLKGHPLWLIFASLLKRAPKQVRPMKALDSPLYLGGPHFMTTQCYPTEKG